MQKTNYRDETIKKSTIEYALNECFDHDLTYKDIIQIFPHAIYHVDGKKILKLYKQLGLKNECYTENKL